MKHTAFGIALFCASGVAMATNIIVTTPSDQFGEDSTRCSLREAVQAANTNTAFGGCPAGTETDVITFQGFTNHFTLNRPGRLEAANATGDIDVNGSGTIVFVGLGAGITVVDADGLDRAFDLACRNDMNVQFIGMTILGGDAGNEVSGGGAIRNCAATLSLTGVHVTENSANRGGGLVSQASAGPVTITRSAFTRNRAFESDGSAIRHNAGGLIRLTNTTLSENVAEGGAALSSTADVTLKNVTVASNTGPTVAGVSLSSGILRIDNSIIADNSARSNSANGADLYCATVAISYGHNIIERRNCNFTSTLASDLAVDPMLGTLADAGRSLPVHVLLPGSPAINSGAPVPNDGSLGQCAANDQRSIQRLQCDRGAFEYRVDYAVNSTADAPDSNPGNGICQSTLGNCTLRAALMEAGAQNTPIVISIPAGIYNVNIPGEDEDLGATGDLDIIALEGEGRILMGAGPDRTIIRGSGVERVFDLGSNSFYRSSIGLFGMRIEGGDTVHAGNDGAAFNGGGARFLFPRMLTIDRVWFDRNHSGSSGGGLHVLQGSGPVRITRSAFTRNTAVRDGGGTSLGQGKDMVVSSSVFADNVATRTGGGFNAYNTSRLELSWSTITGNMAGGQGGGVSLRGGEILGSMLITGNLSGHAVPAHDCSTLATGTVSAGYNLIGSVGSGACVLTGDTTGNQFGVDMGLSPVNMIGADLPYAAPRVGSIALAAVPQFRCQTSGGQFQHIDQQGNARPVGNACTVGALERTSDLIFAHGMDDSYAGE